MAEGVDDPYTWNENDDFINLTIFFLIKVQDRDLINNLRFVARSLGFVSTVWVLVLVWVWLQFVDLVECQMDVE